MYASLIGTGGGGSSRSTLFSHPQVQLQSQRQYNHHLFEDSVTTNRYYNNFLYGQQVPTLYPDYSSVQQESWRQQGQQSIPTTTIQANDSNRYGTMVQNVAHLTSREGLHRDSIFNTNRFVSKNNCILDGHFHSLEAAYAETSVPFQNIQQQCQQLSYFQGIDLSQNDLVDPKGGMLTISFPHTKKTNILDHSRNNDMLECNISNQASQTTNINEIQAYNTSLQTSIIETSQEQKDQDYFYLLSVLLSTQGEQQNHMRDLTVASIDSYRNSNSSTPTWTADESSSHEITPGHSRNVTGETSLSNMDFSKMDFYRRGSQQTDMTGPSNTMHRDQDRRPETDSSPCQSLVSHNNQTSDQSITQTPSTMNPRRARKGKKAKPSCEPDDIPKWKCIYLDCPEMYGRKEDLFNKHIFTHHFGNEVKYTCRIGSHKQPSRSTYKRYVAWKHIKTCWIKLKHRYSDKDGAGEDPPQELYSINCSHITGYHCGVDGCHQAMFNKKKLEEHVWREHDHLNPDILTYECPYCSKVVKEPRTEYIKKHKNRCAKLHKTKITQE